MTQEGMSYLKRRPIHKFLRKGYVCQSLNPYFASQIHTFNKVLAYAFIRCDLLDSVNAILQINSLSNLSLQEITKALLYGHERLPADANKKILLATLEYIHASERFQ